jgi:hypothetical protein
MSLSLRSPRTVAAGVAIAACLAAAGCGSGSSDPLSGMSAKQIATKAVDSLKSAPAFTIVGSGPDDGHTININLGFKGGKDCVGTLSEGSEGSLDLVVIGNTVWLKPDATFWKTQAGSAGAQVAKVLAGKYVQAPTSNSNAASLAGVCNASSMTSQMNIPTDVTKGALTTVDGKKVLPLIDKSKDSTLYVTDTSTPQIVQVVSRQSGNSGQFTITYGVPTTVSAPPGSQTVNGAQYGF